MARRVCSAAAPTWSRICAPRRQPAAVSPWELPFPQRAATTGATSTRLGHAAAAIPTQSCTQLQRVGASLTPATPARIPPLRGLWTTAALLQKRSTGGKGKRGRRAARDAAVAAIAAEEGESSDSTAADDDDYEWVEVDPSTLSEEELAELGWGEAEAGQAPEDGGPGGLGRVRACWLCGRAGHDASLCPVPPTTDYDADLETARLRHRPVLAAEVFGAMDVAGGNRRFLDATFGAGGHARELLKADPAST